MALKPESNDTAPLVSVVIPAYNCEYYLARAISSALAQTYCSVECIVVNDGSTDRTADVIASFGDRVRSVTQPNGGASAARNVGIGMARGAYVAFLDADDYWLPTKIANQVEVFRRHPGLVLVSCDFIWERPGDATEATADASPPFQADHVRVFHDLTELLRNPYLGTPTVIVDASALREVGGFDTSLPLGEDVDLYFRLCEGRSYAILHQSLTRAQLRHGSLTTQIRGYADNLRVFDRLTRSLSGLNAEQHELLDAQRMAVYRRWVSDLLVRGAGVDAREVLRRSREAGRLPGYVGFYLKSLIAPILPPLRKARRTLAEQLSRGKLGSETRRAK